MSVAIALRRECVAPARNTEARSTIARYMLSMDRRRIPASMPGITLAMAIPSTTPIMSGGTRRVSGDTEQIPEPGGDLGGAQPDRRREPDQGAEHGQDVDRVTHRPVNPVADQGIEGRRRLERPPQHDTGRPGVEPPMKERVVQRDLGRMSGPAGADRRFLEVRDRRGDPVVHETDTRPGSEHHAHP